MKWFKFEFKTAYNSVAISQAPKVKLGIVDNSTAIVICGKYQTVDSSTVMGFKANTRSHTEKSSIS